MKHLVTHVKHDFVIYQAWDSVPYDCIAVQKGCVPKNIWNWLVCTYSSVSKIRMYYDESTCGK